MEEQEEDTAAFQVRGNSDVEVVTYEYHILYSPSYGVPVLYFNAHTQGSLSRVHWANPVYTGISTKWI